MNEMDLLEDFRAVVAAPDPDTMARTRARLLHPDRFRTPSPRLPLRRPWVTLAGLAAVATTAAVTVMALPGAAPARHPVALHPGLSGGVVSPVAQELAYRAAAAAQAGPNVRPGQWVYWKETVTSQGARPATPEGIFQVWTTANSMHAAYIYHGRVVLLEKGPFTGQPVPYQGSVSYVTGPISVSYASLSSLPSDPIALDRYLAGLHPSGWGPAPVREFAVIEELLTSYVMPPGLTAEMYRALGDIPGVTVARAVDVAGRHGIGFQITMPMYHSGNIIEQLILDPRTFALMGQTSIVPHGKVLSGTAILKTALVSGPGRLP